MKKESGCEYCECDPCDCDWGLYEDKTNSLCETKKLHIPDSEIRRSLATSGDNRLVQGVQYVLHQ